MKKLLLFSIALLSFASVNAQTIETGYHGFVEGAYSIEINGATLAMNWPEINTIHGYQATPNLFVGAGEYHHGNEIVRWKFLSLQISVGLY